MYHDINLPMSLSLDSEQNMNTTVLVDFHSVTMYTFTLPI